MPINYQNGKIYKIIDNTNGNIYIGSTAEPTLARRLAGHVGTYKHKVKTGKGANCKSFEIIQNGDYRIILIEDYPCDSKDQLNQREQFHMNNNQCINQLRASTDREAREAYKKKWREENRDYAKQYQIENQEKLNRYRKELREYMLTWGGDKRFHNNFLNIDPNLFE
tara:strand:+ start:1878 stop:2378 length:501 start_codon:yes stop_codon:yes gene_type:complete